MCIWNPHPARTGFHRRRGCRGGFGRLPGQKRVRNLRLTAFIAQKLCRTATAYSRVHVLLFFRREVGDFLPLSVFPGGKTCVLPKDCAEIALGMEAEVLGDGADIGIGIFQHVPGGLDAAAPGVFRDSHGLILLEFSGEIGGADADFICHVF